MSEHTGDIYTQAQHEKEMTRLEVQSKRWFIAWIVTFTVLMVSLIGTNLAWVIYENSYQDVVIEQDADVSGESDNYMNGMGDFNYGWTRTPENTDTGEEGVE